MLTQIELAEKAELSEDTIGALERGKSSPSLASLQKKALALKVGIKDFCDFEDEAEDWKRI
jgi:transcriptional regulator with XRE-family HTH domain